MVAILTLMSVYPSEPLPKLKVAGSNPIARSGHDPHTHQETIKFRLNNKVLTFFCTQAKIRDNRVLTEIGEPS